jgi:pimeloyl-ACP methyl ester carboxylesterase
VPTAIRDAHVGLADDRVLEYSVLGADDGPTVVFHHGSPGSAFTNAGLDAAALRAGIRVLAPSRAGYAGSTRDEGRSIASVVPDTLALLDSLGVERFVAAGWSGGGPHAIACAALATGRCAAALSLAGVAPYLPGEFEWLEGMGEENVEEFHLAIEAGPAYDASLDAGRELLLSLDASRIQSVREVFGSLISDADNDAVTTEDAAFVCDLAARAVRGGVGGWRDDDQAFLRPWGFDVAEVNVPVGVWYGDQDLMVPTRHGTWLVEHLGNPTARHLPADGHFSMVFGHFDEILATLRDLADGAW